jgi:hypothetical protein
VRGPRADDAEECQAREVRSRRRERGVL